MLTVELHSKISVKAVLFTPLDTHMIRVERWFSFIISPTIGPSEIVSHYLQGYVSLILFMHVFS